MARRSRSYGKESGDYRQRRKRDADRPRNSGHRGVADDFPALIALGIAQSAIPHDHSGVAALPDAGSAALPALVPAEAGMDLWRPAAFGPPEGSRVAQRRSLAEPDQ